MMLNAAISEIQALGHDYQKISVPGAFEVPSAISYAADLDTYDGYVALGCVIKGETLHHEIVARESARGINDLSMNLNLAIGNGIITVDNYEQALFRADSNKGNRGGFAAQAAVKMAMIKNKFFEILQNDD